LEATACSTAREKEEYNPMELNETTRLNETGEIAEHNLAHPNHTLSKCFGLSIAQSGKLVRPLHKARWESSDSPIP